MKFGKVLTIAAGFLAVAPLIVIVVLMLFAFLINPWWAWFALLVIGIPIGLAGNLQDAGFGDSIGYIVWPLIGIFSLILSIMITKFIRSSEGLRSEGFSYIYWFLVLVIIISYVAGLVAAYVL